MARKEIQPFSFKCIQITSSLLHEMHFELRKLGLRTISFDLLEKETMTLCFASTMVKTSGNIRKTEIKFKVFQSRNKCMQKMPFLTLQLVTEDC